MQNVIIEFTKMHGLGNDFVVIDAIHQTLNLQPEQIRQLAHRRHGVGCDQVLLVESATPQSPCDFRYRIFNADGREVEQCGNGARCFALFVREQGLTDKTAIMVETAAGQIELRMEEDGQVTVDMGPPYLEPWQIPFDAPIARTSYPLEVDGHTYTIGAVSMGNPHAILHVDDVALAPVAQLGPLIERHLRFPRQVNVGFMQILSAEEIRLRVFERGVGETQACGSGACAAVVSARLQGLLADKVVVELLGGRLTVAWSGEPAAHVVMTGPATSVFKGSIVMATP